ncbi:Spc19-domain-containing protein [Coprinopsis sp. MPI-PUGE-AT-0042]|nr:Spc19-domain-containing protein [Coprinopsis sp. MPI-PUGE-AT-0042]
MSRLSRAPLKGRESVFHSGPEHYLGDTQAMCPPSLEECVMAMEDCCEETFEAQHLLRNGTKDFPRMSKVIQSERVFLLVTEGLVKKHQRGLADEMETTVSELITRAEQGLAALQKKEANLQSKLDSGAVTTKPAGGMNTAQKSEARKVKLLTVQRESLEKQVQALEEEVMLLEAKARKR